MGQAGLKMVKLRLSAGVRIPRWMKYLESVEIGYEQVKGRRIRFIKFRRVSYAHFGAEGSVWLTLPEFRGGFRYFPNTLQILGARDKVLAWNIHLCPRCFTLSGKMLGKAVPTVGIRVKGQFTCTNDGCNEEYEREWQM